MPTDSEQITTVIRSHLDALRTGSTESAAATVCAEKQVSTTTTGKVLPAITLDAVGYVTLKDQQPQRPYADIWMTLRRPRSARSCR